MKITPKILSIPPYLSTNWSNIASLQLRSKNERSLLIITLNDGAQIEIPSMAQSDIDEIFQAHANFSEGETPLLKNSLSFTLPLKSTDEGAIIDPLNATMQHNPEQADLRPIPPHVLEKIGSIVRSFGIENTPFLDQAITDCNCIYCQLSRSLRPVEEVVEETDLKFRDWEVSQKEEKLYHVVNPLDKNEYYDVFLGEPIGCTCGSKNCEHICAVLNT